MLRWVAIALASGLRTHMRNLSTRFHEGPKALAGFQLMSWKASNREGIHLCKINIAQKEWKLSNFKDKEARANRSNLQPELPILCRWPIWKTFLHVWSHMRTAVENVLGERQETQRSPKRSEQVCLWGLHPPFYLVGGGWFWQPLSRWSSVARGRYYWTISLF